MSRPEDTYKVCAVRYGHHDRPASENFLGGDPHDDNMPLAYFVWVVQGPAATFIVDTGFASEDGAARGRKTTRSVADGLGAVGIDPAKVENIIITHMHYDHAGNRDLFPKATYHVQDREMQYCTGRCMCHSPLAHPFDKRDVSRMVERVFDKRVCFHDGDAVIAPGLSVHRVGGHTDGLQVVRVNTAAGTMVLASDASHLYANMEQQRPFPAVYNVGDMLEGYRRLYSLTDKPELVIPGHDPDVLKRFPAASRELDGWVVQLDAGPR